MDAKKIDLPAPQLSLVQQPSQAKRDKRMSALDMVKTPQPGSPDTSFIDTARSEVHAASLMTGGGAMQLTSDGMFAVVRVVVKAAQQATKIKFLFFMGFVAFATAVSVFTS